MNFNVSATAQFLSISFHKNVQKTFNLITSGFAIFYIQHRSSRDELTRLHFTLPYTTLKDSMKGIDGGWVRLGSMSIG